jgi:hypothetical protein
MSSYRHFNAGIATHGLLSQNLHRGVILVYSFTVRFPGLKRKKLSVNKLIKIC